MITVYTKNYCPYCVQAKKQLESMGFEYEEINIETDAESRSWLIKQGHRTMPQIYYQGRLLVEGGASGLAKLTEDEVSFKMGVIDFDVNDVNNMDIDFKNIKL